MAYLNPSVMDNGLIVLTNGVTTINLCSDEPAVYGDLATLSLGEGSVSASTPTDRTGGGRQVTISACSDGEVTASGTATHWALTDGVDTLYAAGSLATPLNVSTPGSFSTTEFVISIVPPAE